MAGKQILNYPPLDRMRFRRPCPTNGACPAILFQRKFPTTGDAHAPSHGKLVAMGASEIRLCGRGRRRRWMVVAAVAGFLQLGWGTQLPAISPAELVRKTVQNEVRASESPSTAHMFVSRKEGTHGSQTKLYCETKDAMAGMAIANDGKPLTPEQRQAEEARLEQLMRDPGELRKKREREKEEAERATRIVRAMPDAFLYEYDGIEPSKPGMGQEGDELVRVKFRPNPKYSPPTRTEQVLEAMQGYILIDADKQRIARIDGTVYKDVGFGWGILGHLDKGGHFLVEQGDVGDGTWDTFKMSLAFTGKIFFFKHFELRSTETLSDFRPVPKALTFAQGVDLLKKQESVLAQDGHGSASPK